MDIIVTTPKSEIANAAREAADCIAAGGGDYFRRFHPISHPDIEPGSRVYYVEAGYIRGFAVVARVQAVGPAGLRCDTTGRIWSQGWYASMPAESWRWIRPIPTLGCRGFRYAVTKRLDSGLLGLLTWADPASDPAWYPVIVVGGWLFPRPGLPAGPTRC